MTFVLLTLQGSPKRKVLVNLTQASFIMQDGNKARIYFDDTCDPTGGLPVREGVDCIAKALGASAVTPQAA